MEGSDFSYEDMGGGDAFVDDFSSVREDDEEMEGWECYRLELTRKPGSDSAYSRMKMWIRKDNFVPVVIDYYPEKNPGQKEKRLVLSDVEVFDGIPTPKKMVMFNENDGTQTEMEFLHVKYNLILSDAMFTERELKK